MDKLPIINGVIIRSIEFINGIYVCGSENHIESIISENFNSEIVEMMKRNKLTWIYFFDNKLEYETNHLMVEIADLNKPLTDDINIDKITTDILKTLMNKTFNLMR